MFAGVGGLSLGVKQAGFNVLAAIEKEPINCATYKSNFPNTKVFENALEDVDMSEISKLGKVDAVFGGPPCQGFSLMGKRNIDDPRNQLIFDYLTAASELDPSYIVMEDAEL
jgi:DNA (cytosine-5)-methyltransferase 1